MISKGLTVYCASSVTIDEVYFKAARDLGAEIARRGYTLITGAGSMGLMGAVNDAAIAAGGRTVGVIPHGLAELGGNSSARRHRDF